ncbi:MAG: ankyrin repeat domain-containing protein [Alphaproteobacteria bacterium]
MAAPTPQEAAELGRQLLQELCCERKDLDVARCEKLISQGADLGFDKDRSLSPLLRATRHGLPGVVTAILDRGVDVNEKDAWGWTALMVASSVGWADMAQLLIDRKADIHAVSDKEETPFSLAQKSGAKATEEVLIKAERRRQQDLAALDSLAAQFQEALMNAHIVQEPIKVGHALRLVSKGGAPS